MLDMGDIECPQNFAPKTSAAHLRSDKDKQINNYTKSAQKKDTSSSNKDNK